MIPNVILIMSYGLTLVKNSEYTIKNKANILFLFIPGTILSSYTYYLIFIMILCLKYHYKNSHFTEEIEQFQFN